MSQLLALLIMIIIADARCSRYSSSARAERSTGKVAQKGTERVRATSLG
jgi:hypothetical protein